MNAVQLWLTCGDLDEAIRIEKTLLDKKLIVCGKKIPVAASFLWGGKLAKNDEILLVMDSREDLFDQVEAVIIKLHSYDTFVLQAIPVVRTSVKAKAWQESELNNENH